MKRIHHLPTIFLTLLLWATITQAGMLEDVDRAIQTTALSGGDVAVSVRDAQTGQELVSIDAERKMIPASNMKLITSGAALHTLGADFTFQTKLFLDGDRLIVVGDGDPAFGDPDLLRLMTVNGEEGFDVESFLDLWVQAVADAKVTHLSEVVVDDRIFDREFIHESWPIEQLNQRSFAEISGLNFHLNVLRFYPKVNKGSRPNISNFQPKAGWLIPTNRATCRTGPHDGNDMWISRQLGTNKLTIYGNVKSDRYSVMVPVTVHDMPTFFSHLLTDRLRRAGITVDKFGVLEPTAPLQRGQLLEPIITTPLFTVLTRCNRDSKNIYAECLLKRIVPARTQQPGSWSQGAALIRAVLFERLESRQLAAQVVIADGSGLSRDNRIAPGTMTMWLGSFYTDEKLGPVFIDSMADAAETGTLAKRFGNINLHRAQVKAKTGYINGVSCLSGYVTAPNGKCAAFSIMVNNLPAHKTVYPAKRMQEKIVSAIAKNLVENTATPASPSP